MNYERLYSYRFRDIDQEGRAAVWNEIAPHVHGLMGSPQKVLDPAAGRGEFGGTIFDLLENERGPEACERLVAKLLPQGPEVQLEDAFDARFREIEDAWRDYLREMVRGPVAV